jgi:hypothetical protein
LKLRWKKNFGAANMFYHNKLLYLLAIIFPIIFLGCATSYAPNGWLSEAEDIPTNIYGGWITIVTKPNNLQTEETSMQYSGEFISVDSTTIYLLYDSVYQIPKNIIRNSTLELYQKKTKSYSAWTILGTLSTISNGFFLVVTAPLWLAVGIPVTISESSRDNYEMEYPDDAYWNEVKQFARFPQGIDKADLNQIKLYSNFEE